MRPDHPDNLADLGYVKQVIVTQCLRPDHPVSITTDLAVKAHPKITAVTVTEHNLRLLNPAFI